MARSERPRPRPRSSLGGHAITVVSDYTRHQALTAGSEAAPLGGGGGARVPGAALWRVAAAEACGTALLVALTCLPGCAARALAPAERALAGGLAVAALVQCFDHVSGAHFNPTVTLAALLARRVGAAHAGAALAAQAAGALAGAAALAPATGALARCVTRPAPGVSAWAALGVEALLGAVLALINLASWDARCRAYKDSWPLRVGFTVAALSLAAGEVTGASANPLRSAAPALLTGDLRALWVYCVGPPGGAALAAALYACAWRAAPPPA
ncbi:aquaporin AQPAn.G-like [Bicyclus anynana]|uniref:Aquaporin AQPAn.G-like n=1 Tax=Bicyclus anynana TaxID=110368 RepID=A0ABM3LFM0_BICAN|nr:aquaporin AQPAn.G-like [Bicyclus anynana]